MSTSERFEAGIHRAKMARAVCQVMQRPDYHQMSNGQIRGALKSALEREDVPYLSLMDEYGISSRGSDGTTRTGADFCEAMSRTRSMAIVHGLRLNHPSGLKIRNDLVYRAWETFADVSGGQTALRLTNLRSGHLGVWRVEPNVPDHLLFVDEDMDLVANFILAELRLVNTEVEAPDWMAEARQLLDAWGSPPQVVDHGVFISLRNPGVQHPAIVSRLRLLEGDDRLRLHVNQGLVAEGGLDYVMRCALDHVENEEMVRARIRRAFGSLRMVAALAPSSLRDKLYERWCAVGLNNGEGQATMWQELGDLYPDQCVTGVKLQDLVTHILGGPPIEFKTRKFSAAYEWKPEIPQLNLTSSERQLAQEEAVRMTSKHLPHLSDLRLPVSGARFTVTSLDGKLPLGEVGFISIKAREMTAEQEWWTAQLRAGLKLKAPAGYAGHPLGEFPKVPTRPEVCDWYWATSPIADGQFLCQILQSEMGPGICVVKWHAGGTSPLPWGNLVARAIAPTPRGDRKFIGKDLPYDEVDP